MRVIIFMELFYFLFVSGQPCSDENSLDLTNAEHYDSDLIKDGVRFPPNYVYTKNVSGEIKTFGCVCEFKKCFRKCCPLGQVFLKSPSGKKCVDEYDIIQTKGLNVSYINQFKGTVNINETDKYMLFHGMPCGGVVYIEDRDKWFIQEDGQLYIEVPTSIPPWILRGPEKYCVDTFIFEDDKGARTTSFDALVCFATEKDKENYVLSSTCMLISCVFFLATVAVYGWLPELRNLHGRVLMAYLLCLFVGFICMSTMQILLKINDISKSSCVALSIMIYFSLLAAFFWLNVMCFDIWWTFSGNRGMSMEKMSLQAKFYAYSIYAFGIPTALTIIVVALEFSGLPPHPLLPSLRHHGCFFSGKSKLFYLYGPIVILCFANIVFFVLTAVKIAQIKKQISVLKHRESAKHDGQNKEKQRLLLYIKLFIVMGINWLLEVVSAIYPNADHIFRFIDAYNVLIGLIIFIIFVCKRKIIGLLKKRIKEGILHRKQGISNMTMVHRNDTVNNLRNYKQRDSLDTIRTCCPETGSNKTINTTNL
ncbi:G-protein coupled receptor Mth-like isoform X4 [Vanessa atalanta]|uniref:G-protein coupled receptor Mth-like isoform X4 n=1 Tax=Vanessa atalanta TaxID=42275 RepID=UPI001FCD3D2F|nr:G-protein coupled receptor Mth-like isoform X4 [Vanessa atalanta]